MKLTLQEIKSVARGVVNVTEEADGFHFFRFSESEREMYSKTKFASRTDATAGVSLEFDTDATGLFLAITESSASSRKYFAVDIFVDGGYVGCLRNYEDGNKISGYAGRDYPEGDFEGDFDLGSGRKRVRVLLPWSAKCVIRRLELAGATFITPTPDRPKLLIYGDSITHGYDALHPSGTYTDRLAQALGYEGVNKGIGGEIFRPELAALDSGVSAEMITVAYGSNDWNSLDADTLRANCRGFFETLCKRQKNARIFAITPIWRRDEDDPPRVCGPFSVAESIIREVCADLPVTVIRGYDLLPREIEVFGDTKLHPNHYGFDFYFKNVLAAIQNQ